MPLTWMLNTFSAVRFEFSLRFNLNFIFVNEFNKLAEQQDRKIREFVERGSILFQLQYSEFYINTRSSRSCYIFNFQLLLLIDLVLTDDLFFGLFSILDWIIIYFWIVSISIILVMFFKTEHKYCTFTS